MALDNMGTCTRKKRKKKAVHAIQVFYEAIHASVLEGYSCKNSNI